MTKFNFETLLDFHFDRLQDALSASGNTLVHEAMSELITSIRSIRMLLDEASWGEFIRFARSHELFNTIQQCPFTSHAFRRPRGYPGDAELLDFIYFKRFPTGNNEVAKKLFSYTSNAPAPRAVCSRMEYFAQQIDQDPDAKTVLSVACGHLREAGVSQRIINSQVSVTAFDQDQASLDFVESEYGHLDVSTVSGSVKDLLKRGRVH